MQVDLGAGNGDGGEGSQPGAIAQEQLAAADGVHASMMTTWLAYQPGEYRSKMPTCLINDCCRNPDLPDEVPLPASNFIYAYPAMQFHIYHPSEYHKNMTLALMLTGNFEHINK